LAVWTILTPLSLAQALFRAKERVISYDMTRDVLIVGAGPSGAYLGYLLARQGFKVLIIDKATFPRDKVCGGGISNKTIELLDFDISPVVHHRVNGAFLTFQNQDTVVKDLDDRGGAAVVRAEFDNYLLQKAVKVGAEFRGNTAFVGAKRSLNLLAVETTGGTVTTRYLVGADGVFSQVRSALFGRDLVTYAPAVEALVYLPPATLNRIGKRVLFDFGGMPRGYGWIFPKRDHLNVGVFSIYKTASIQSDLRRFMSWYRVLDSPLKVKQLGSAIPLRNTRRHSQSGRVLLLGDAAGFAESFYGEGIHFALKSALVASKALAMSFDAPESNTYQQLVQKDLHDDLAYSELNAKLFFPRQSFGFYRMVRSQHVNYYFSELIAGRVGHKECFYKTLFSSPYWLFSSRLPPYAGAAF
jgi:geranylgeranyl reductase family protein